ncbi:MAG: hypothetical protein L6455_13325 [Kiritimatiellae bacterium]|nr:hypothetical protein [Kiritimatiellia bacterium]
MRPVQISIAPIMTTVGESVVATAWAITRFPMMTKITPKMFGTATQTIHSSLLMKYYPPFAKPTWLLTGTPAAGNDSLQRRA